MELSAGKTIQKMKLNVIQQVEAMIIQTLQKHPMKPTLTAAMQEVEAMTIQAM